MTGSRLRALALILAVAAGLTAGCRDNPPVQPPPSEMDQQMMSLVSLYMNYRNKHGGKAPASLDELKKWVKTLKVEELSRLGLGSDVDSTFVSPRDKREFGMTQPKNDMASKMGAIGLIFYEKEGVNGKHVTIAGMGARPAEIDRDLLVKQVPNLGK